MKHMKYIQFTSRLPWHTAAASSSGWHTQHPANYGDKAIRAASQGEMISVSHGITKEVNQKEPNRIIFAKFQNSNCE